jgi:uncharacterized protein YciI
MLLAGLTVCGLVTESAAARRDDTVVPEKPMTVQGLGPLYYMILFRPGPNWIKGKPYTQQPLLEHGRYLQSLYEQHILVLAGPFTDDAGGFVILNCQSATAAAAIAADEPATRAGIFTEEIHPIRYAFDLVGGRSVWAQNSTGKP